MGSETKDGANPFPAAISCRECEAFALGVRGQIEMSPILVRFGLFPPLPLVRLVSPQRCNNARSLSLYFRRTTHEPNIHSFDYKSWAFLISASPLSSSEPTIAGEPAAAATAAEADDGYCLLSAPDRSRRANKLSFLNCAGRTPGRQTAGMKLARPLFLD